MADVPVLSFEWGEGGAVEAKDMVLIYLKKWEFVKSSVRPTALWHRGIHTLDCAILSKLKNAERQNVEIQIVDIKM
jgi:hypothetical protein